MIGIAMVVFLSVIIPLGQGLSRLQVANVWFLSPSGTLVVLGVIEVAMLGIIVAIGFSVAKWRRAQPAHAR